MNTQAEPTTPSEEERTEISVAELVRKQESDYTSGHTQLSKHVSFSLFETLNTIEAYLASRHTTGEEDSLGREKPFFNIVTAAVNVWFRATDIDRSNIRIRATKAKDWLDSFFATVFLQEWMRKEFFGQFLNDWGLTLSRYGGAILKFVENSEGLHVMVMPWNRMIVDAVDFDQNPQIEVMELTEGELRKRVTTMGYDSQQVSALRMAMTPRETLDKKRKDNKSNYIKVYELHGMLPLSTYKQAKGLPVDTGDRDRFVQQMHVVSFVAKKEGRKTEYQDFTLYAGREDESPYMLTDLIKTDGRTLPIGAVEHLFGPQWMVNHSTKAMKDQLDIASRVVFQTADKNFVGRNVLTDLEQGSIFVYDAVSGSPLSQVNNQGHDLVGLQNFAVMWKGLGNEINGISEAMLGAAPKSGTAWRQTEAVLNESYSLFELMTESKGLYIERMLRERIIPYLKRTQMDNSEELAATLSDFDITRIDSMYIKGEATNRTNRDLVKMVLGGEVPTPEKQQQLMAQHSANLSGDLQALGNTRFFKPSEISKKTWKTQFKDLEWELEIDVTGEPRDVQGALTTLNTALQLMLIPGFEQNPKAQAVVGRVLEMSGAMSPMEYQALPPAPSIPTPATAPPPNQPAPAFGGGGAPLAQ